MRIALVHEAKLPVFGYGGTERVLWWLAKGLAQAGVEVVLACRPGSTCSFAKVAFPDFKKPIEDQLPGVNLFHYFNSPESEPSKPYCVTIEGNGKVGETFYKNTIFVSRNHAERHGSKCFVYNGIDPEDYLFSRDKSDSLLFLARASWSVKNVRGAIRMARKKRKHLAIVGGSRPWPLKHWRKIHWEGTLGGSAKAKKIADASALLFPVLWDEPFGIAVIEALVSGTPVLASPFGSLPELVNENVGAICRTESEFLSAIEKIPAYKPDDCRAYAEKFHYQRMAENYINLYETVLAGRPLNPENPKTREPLRQYQL